jgi:hypothetical protein
MRHTSQSLAIITNGMRFCDGGGEKEAAPARTDEAGRGLVGVVDGALDDVLVEPGEEVVDLHLAAQVVGVEREAARVQLHLPHRLQRLHHLRAHVQDLRRHRRRPARRRRLGGARRGRGGRLLIARGHLQIARRDGG